jgi:hypothetical protein
LNWLALEAIGVAVTAAITLATAVIMLWNGFLMRSATNHADAASSQANAAATKLADIESQRRHGELCPRFRVICEPFNQGSDILRLRIMLVGPSGLDRVDRLTLAIRNDHFRRGEGHQQIMDGPTEDEIKAHIWGPYRFLAAPDDARPDDARRMVVYTVSLPMGEELPYQLEPLPFS